MTWYTYYSQGYSYAPMSDSGHKTPTWNYLRDVNGQILALAPIMCHLESTGVFFSTPTPADNLPMLPGQLIASATCATPLMLGEFRGPKNESYVMVVNLSLESSAKFDLQNRETRRDAANHVSPIDPLPFAPTIRRSRLLAPRKPGNSAEGGLNAFRLTCRGRAPHNFPGGHDRRIFRCNAAMLRPSVTKIVFKLLRSAGLRKPAVYAGLPKNARFGRFELVSSNYASEFRIGHSADCGNRSDTTDLELVTLQTGPRGISANWAVRIGRSTMFDWSSNSLTPPFQKNLRDAYYAALSATLPAFRRPKPTHAPASEQNPRPPPPSPPLRRRGVRTSSSIRAHFARRLPTFAASRASPLFP